LFIGVAVCLVGLVSLFEEVGKKRNLSLDHGGSQAAGGLRLPVTGSLLGDATWNFPLLIHDRDELNKLAFIAQFLGSYTYRVSHPPSFCIR